MPLEFRQEHVDEVAVQRRPVDRLPARVRCADANTLRGNQQHAVIDAEVSTALRDKLSKTRVSARRAVDLLVHLVDERQLAFDLQNPIVRSRQFPGGPEIFADELDRRLQNTLDDARVERRGFAGIPREHRDQQTGDFTLIVEERKYQDRPGGLQGFSQRLVLVSEPGDVALGKFADEIVDLEIF